MTCIRRLYDCGNRKVTPSSSHHHHLEPAPKVTRCARITGGLVWLITRPFVWGHAAYNGALLAKSQELSGPLLQAVDYSRPLTPFPFPNMMLYILPHGMEVFQKAPRHDPSGKGLFVDQVNHEVFLPILKDIIQGPVTRSDFLFTCPPEEAKKYRAIILEFMGPKNQPHIHAALEETAKWMMEEMPLDGRVTDGEQFCGTFTAGVISRVFLNHPGPVKAYHEIYWAMKQVDKYAMLKRWGKLSPEGAKEYARAIEIIREAIQVAEKNPGPFVQTMKAQDFTDTQIKATLFLTYLAGAGTTTTTLKYLLWQLGQHPEFQATMHKGFEQERLALVTQAINEALRLAPPAGIIGRFAAQDLKYTITHKGLTIYSYTIPKGSGILMAPLCAGRNPKIFKDPKTFKPQRFKDTALHPALPFGSGFHGCPGKSLALHELTTFLLTLLHRYTLTSYPHQRDLKSHLFLTLHHPTPVQLHFTPRKGL